MTVVAVLAAALIIGGTLIYFNALSQPAKASAPTAPVVAAVARSSAPAAEDVFVLRLEKDGTFSLNGRRTPPTDLPPALREHAQQRAASALIVEVHPSLPANALLEVMEMAHICGIQRTAVRRVND